jgi:Acyl-coenzyme A:6-aminopenicillanic acid acyl-transferase
MGCFLIGVTGEGGALLGGVSDDPYDVRTFVRRVAPEGGLAHVGTELISTTERTLTERGYFARPGETTRGVNGAGLAFTCAMVIEKDEQEGAIPFADLTEKMMACCHTVDEAIDLFNQPVHPAYSLLLADAEGHIAHLEVGTHGTEVYERYSQEEPGALFAVNCYLSQALVNYNAPHTLITDPKNNNAARRERGMALAQELHLDVEGLQRILSDHENRERDPRDNPVLSAWGYSICNHGTRFQDTYPKEDLPWGTVSAEILEPSTKRLWYAYGWPCGGTPEHGDQLFQENSWGKFVPFDVGEPESGVTPLTTPEGKIL